MKRALLLAATTAFAVGLVDGRSACTASWGASPDRALNITQPIPEFAGVSGSCSSPSGTSLRA